MIAVDWLIGPVANAMGPILMPFPANNSWSIAWNRHAISSPLLLTATCAHASLHLDYLSREVSSRRSIELVGSTLTMLRKSLQPPKIEAYASDESVGAIALLVASTVNDSILS